MWTAMPPRKSQRRQQILEALAQMLEAHPGNRITTAGLAKQVGVSEAALYRHFPSKSKMFEGLIEFIEETLFSRISIILNEEHAAAPRCEKMLMLLLAFAERNPGITRILTGDALAGETERLHQRVAQLFDRFETQLRQVIREGYPPARGRQPADGGRGGTDFTVRAQRFPTPAHSRLATAVGAVDRRLFPRGGDPADSWPGLLLYQLKSASGRATQFYHLQ
jgi:AcrR family transcriptional regulator